MSGVIKKIIAHLSSRCHYQIRTTIPQSYIIWAQLVSEHRQSGTPALATLRGMQEEPILLEAEGLVITQDIQPAPKDQASVLGR